MNYRGVYNRLMLKAWRRVEVVGYSEKHHVIPRCLGGGNSKDNLVILTAAEHYIAHLLLMKMHPERRNMALPIILMSKNIGIGKRNKLVAVAREMAAQSHRGQKRSEETRKRISEAALKSFKEDPERAKEIIKRNKARVVSEETRKKIGDLGRGKEGFMKGKNHSQESKEKISASLQGNQRALGHKHSAEDCAKFSEQRKGNKYALGMKHTDETKARISKSTKGVPKSPETRARMSLARRRQERLRNERRELLNIWAAT